MSGHYEVTYQEVLHCLKKKKVAGMKRFVTGKKEKNMEKLSDHQSGTPGIVHFEREKAYAVCKRNIT